MEQTSGHFNPAAPHGQPPQPMPSQLKVNRLAIPGVYQVIAVASGKGGVGKSTVCSNLAVALADKGKRVGLLDGDIYGPSAPTMFGLSGALSVNASNRLTPKEAFGVKVVSFGFFSDARHPVMWRGPMIAKAFHQFCYDVDWGKLDYLLVDLPPGTGDVQLTMLESVPVHKAIIVTTPQEVALIDAHKAVSMFEHLRVEVLGVVANMIFYQCSHCQSRDFIFGEQALADFVRARGMRVLQQFPLLPQVRQSCDEGQPAVLNQNSLERQLFLELAEKVI